MSNVVEKLLKYVTFDTKSDDESTTVPTTSKQLVLAKELVKELEAIGMKEVSLDEYGYVMATLPANTDKKIPVIGFLSHMDTSPEISGENVKPQIVENYDGNDIVLNQEKNIILSTEDFKELKEYKGKTLITTDGTTLLGADDKAGIAEIMTAMEHLINHPEITHGKIRVAFTPDEEVGRGTDYFDVTKFGVDFAYTLDGGPIGELEYENFNAAGAKIKINGKSVHPGSAKDTMINAILVANEFISMLPAVETPTHTEGYEGFYHVVSINGGVEEASMNLIIRDHNKTIFENRKQNVEKIAVELNKKYGEGTVNADIKDQYYNMKEKVEPVKHIVDTAFEAMKSCGIAPKVQPIRGGTDGAQLSFKGIPTPNLFTGGHNFHGKYEFIPTFAMEKAVDVIVKIIELYSNK